VAAVKFVEHVRGGVPAWDFSSDVCKHCVHAVPGPATGSIVG
jgi:hypothetical protein